MTTAPNTTTLSNGARIVLASAAVTYLIPAFAHLLLEPEVRFHCPDQRPEVWAHFAVAVASIAMGAIFATRPTEMNPDRIGVRSSNFPFVLFLIAAAGVISGLNAMQGAVSARYGSLSMAERFSEGGGEGATAALVLQAIVPLLPWWLLLRDRGVLESGRLSSVLLRAALAVAVAMSVNGLSSAVRATISIVIALFPKAARSILLHDTRRTASSGRRVLVVAALAAAAIPLAAIGMRAKTGSVGDDETWARYLSPSYLAGRNSTHFQHAMAALEIGIDESDSTARFLDRAAIVWSDAAHKAAVLTGNPALGEKPNPASLSRWVLERFALFEVEGRMARSGSSPSIIAAFALCLPPPWSFVAMAAFAWILVRWLDWLLAGTPRISWLGCAIIAFGPLRIITDTPTNLPNPFGIPFIVVALATVARLLSSYPPIAQPPTAHDRPT